MAQIIFFLLLITAIIAFLKFGAANIDRGFSRPKRNVIDGGITPVGAGLKFIVPGLYEWLDTLDCRDIVINPRPVSVVTRDVQLVTVDYQLTLHIEGLDAEGKVIKEQEISIVKILTKLGEQEYEAELKTAWERYKKNIQGLSVLKAGAYIQKVIGGFTTDILRGKKEEDFVIYCPNCGNEIPLIEEKNGKKEKVAFCLNEECRKSSVKIQNEAQITFAKEKNIPEEKEKWEEETKKEFQARSEQIKGEKRIPLDPIGRLGWSIGIALHDLLVEDYGIGCRLEIRQIAYPDEMVKAVLSRAVGELEGEATKVRFAKEAEAFQDFFEKTGVSPNLGFVIGKLSEAAPEIIEKWIGGKKEKEKKE